MIANQESQSLTYPLKNVNFVGGFTKKNFGKAQNFFYSPLDLERKQGIFKTVQFDAYC